MKTSNLAGIREGFTLCGAYDMPYYGVYWYKLKSFQNARENTISCKDDMI